MTKPTSNYRKLINGSMPKHRSYQLAVLVIGCLFFGYAFASCSSPTEEIKSNGNENISVNSAENQNVLVAVDPNADFSNFKHNNPQHERLPCLLCHKHEDTSAVPKFPGHQPCTGCHVQQFADNQNQICTICHTNAETGDLKRFPKLKNFSVKFDHAKHLRQTNCANCHQQSNKGVAMTVVSGLNAHTKCFQCHKPKTEGEDRNVDFCGTCHQPGRPNQTTYVAKAFKFNFTHANHKQLNCTNCHTVRAGAGRGKQVSVIKTVMHLPPKGTQSCASCHNNKRTFGGDDFTDCKRCHKGEDFKF